MIAAEISIWATEPIWSSVWKRWQIKHCQSAFHSGGSHLQTLHGENGGSAELQSHCDAQLQKTTWQDIFLAAQNGWVAARPLHHDTMPSWNDLCWIFRWKVKKSKFHICHLVRPCQNHVGRVLEIGNCTKVVLKLCLSGQIIIKPPSMIVRTGKTWARSATESLPTIGVNPILPAAERQTFMQTSQNR